MFGKQGARKGITIALFIVGGFVVFFFLMSAFLGNLMVHSEDRGAGDRAAAKIANFVIPKGFQAARGLDLSFMTQVTLTETRPHTGMTIVLAGMSVAANKDAAEQGIMSSIKGRCSKLIPLQNDQLTVNGELFTFHRMSCAGGQGDDKGYEYEFGSFAGKMPLVTLIAMGPQSTWDPAPIHALLESLH